MKKVNNISSKRIYLKRFTKKNLITRYFDWFKDNKYLYFSRHRGNDYKFQDFEKYYLRMKKDKNLFFAIYHKKNNYFFGTITAHIDKKTNTADLGIFIGDKKYLKRSFGTEAWKLLIKILFKYLDITKVTGGSKIRNKGMIKIFKKNNMKLYKSNLKNKTQVYCLKKNVKEI